MSTPNATDPCVDTKPVSTSTMPTQKHATAARATRRRNWTDDGDRRRKDGILIEQ